MAAYKWAVVFVHGLFSSTATWDRFARLIKADPALSDIEVLRFSYPSPKFHVNPMRRIPAARPYQHLERPAPVRAPPSEGRDPYLYSAAARIPLPGGGVRWHPATTPATHPASSSGSGEPGADRGRQGAMP
jgi:hypothetical protein